MDNNEAAYKKYRTKGAKEMSLEELMKARMHLAYEIGKDKLVGLEDPVNLKYLEKLDKEIDNKLWE